MHPVIKYFLIFVVIFLTGCALPRPMYTGMGGYGVGGYGGVGSTIKSPPTLNPVDVCVRYQADQNKMLQCMEFVKQENDWLREQYAQDNHSERILRNRYSYGYGGMPGFMRGYYPNYYSSVFMRSYGNWYGRYGGCGSRWRCGQGARGIYFSSRPYSGRRSIMPGGSQWRRGHRHHDYGHYGGHHH